MKTISVQVPEALLLQTGESVEDLTRQSQFYLALKYFEVGRLTSGQAAEMCGMNRIDFVLAAGRQGIAVADLEPEELHNEIARATAP